MHKKAQKARLVVVSFSYLLILLIILFRLLNIQVINNRNFIKLAESQHHLTLTLFPQRGMIYDRNMKVFALSLKVFSVYAVPRQIKNKEEVAKQLAAMLDLDEEDVFAKLGRDKSFVWIKRRINEKEAKSIRKLKSKNVALLPESKRYYPNGEMLSHVLGFAGIDERGLEGIEYYYEQYLKGKSGRRSLLRDAKQRMLPAFETEFIPAVDGYNLVLTIDQIIQHIVEEELEKAYVQTKAKGASVVVMDPVNGEILAMANRPDYDLNYFKAALPEERRNRAITDFFEPGSTFKIITASAALEENLVSLDEKFFCENGAYRISRHTLHDHKPHGELTFVEVITKSSNIGVVKVAQKLQEKLLYKYIEKFGFGKLTGIDLPGEVSGMLRPPDKWSKLSIAAIPIGQEIAVTLLQMARALSVIANGGYLVTPRIVQKIVDNNNQTIREHKGNLPKGIITYKTATMMKQILKGVVEDGTGRRAAIAGYAVAGKTGTAQKIDPAGGYSHRKFIASFIGFAPVERPRFVIALMLDEPRPLYYGGLVCAPAFKNIAERLLKYMGVPKESGR